MKMLNKKIVLSTVTFLLSANIVTASLLDEAKFNVGGELSLINKSRYHNTNKLSKNKPGLSLFGGAKLHKNLGAEVGFGFISRGKGAGDIKSSNRVRKMYVEALGFMPLSDKTDLIASTGIGYMKSKPHSSNTSLSKFGARVGIGAAYKIDETLQVRAMVRYHKGDKNFLKHNTSASIGVVYTF